MRRRKDSGPPQYQGPYGTISQVTPHSIGEKLGIRPGDRLVSINGHPVRDILDYRFCGADDTLELVLLRGKRRITFSWDDALSEQAAYQDADHEDDLGLEFEEVTFDGIRRCQCRCSFCFVHQMPPGLRRSLYIRDDDYRYSFLFGNFVTLTNLSQEDWERLAEQRLSPLYVSVHATDLELRRRMLGHPGAPDIIGQLKGLGEMGIQVHTQIVLVPGMNDGPALERTINDLAGLYPTVQTIAIVPVGITRYHRRGLHPPDRSACVELVEWVGKRHRAYRKDLGVSLVHLSDEFYLVAEAPLPPAQYYDEFPQLENGVGLTRQLLDEWADLAPDARTIRPGYQRATVVCGTLIGPTLQRLLADVGQAVGTQYAVLPVVNRFFGATVTVSGLLTGEDVLSTLRRHDLGELVVLPRAMFDAAGQRTLDDLALPQLSQALGARVEMAETIAELLHL